MMCNILNVVSVVGGPRYKGYSCTVCNLSCMPAWWVAYSTGVTLDLGHLPHSRAASLSDPRAEGYYSMYCTWHSINNCSLYICVAFTAHSSFTAASHGGCVMPLIGCHCLCALVSCAAPWSMCWCQTFFITEWSRKVVGNRREIRIFQSELKACLSLESNPGMLSTKSETFTTTPLHLDISLILYLIYIQCLLHFRFKY